MGGFAFLREGLDLFKLTKTPPILVFHASIWGSLELCLGGAKPTKAPVATGLVVKTCEVARLRKLSNLAILSIEQYRADCLNMEMFVDEFATH